MDEIAHLNELLNNISAGALGVGGSMLAVVIFAIWSFLRISNRSVNSNLDMINQFSTWASEQANKRNDTQTSLDTISTRLLDTSIEFERFKTHHETEIATYKTRTDALEEMVAEYKKSCNETVKTVMSQVEQSTAREKKLQSQIDGLIEQSKTLSAQNSELMHMVSALRDENDKLKSERANFEIKTARAMARMEARLQLLDNQENGKTNHEHSQRNSEGDVKQNIGGSILDSGASNHSE